MLREDMDALGTGPRIISKHAAQLDGITRVAGITLHEGTKTGDGLLLAADRTIEGLVITERNIAVGRMIAVKLAINVHCLIVLALAGQLAGMLQLVVLIVTGGKSLDLGNGRIIGIDGAKFFEGLVGLPDVAAQLVIPGHAGQRFRILRIGEQDLLP